MRGSFAKARVLYVPVEEIGGEGKLLRACRILCLSFTCITHYFLLHLSLGVYGRKQRGKVYLSKKRKKKCLRF